MNGFSLSRSMLCATLASMALAAGTVSARDPSGLPPHPGSPAMGVPPGSATGMSPQNMGEGSSQLHQLHMQMMQDMQSMQMTGDTDQDFAMMMKHHHEQAIKMAEIEARNGKSPEMKAMANKVIQSQQQEIKKLDDWLSRNTK